MFYNFEPHRILSLYSFTCFQSRVVGSVLEKQRPITIWNTLPFYGKSVCARKIAYHATFILNKHVFILDSNARRSAKNQRDLFAQAAKFDSMKYADSELIATNKGARCHFEPVTKRRSPRTIFSVDILILLVRDDGNVDNLEQYIANVKHKQLVVLGDGEKSEWVRALCKRHWLDVIQ
jgi:hypothetical protein